jgi:nucleoside-diphosphate-sugar epimerase
LRTVVLGGTRFVGRALVEELLNAGHDVVVVHRGQHEPEGLPEVEHVHVDRRALEPGRLAALGADAMVDVSCMTAREATVALDSAGPDTRLAVASSMDVYRAFGSLWAGVATDPLPLTEESALREEPPPDREYVADGYDYEPREYEKLDVEREYLARGGAVCRLPMVYGPHDYKRREAIVLDRLGEPIPVGAGNFLWSRGFAPEIARGMRLALERPGEVFNLCEAECAPIRLWMEQIAAAANAPVEFVRVPDSELPEDLEIAGDIAQHVLASPAKAERMLGWAHADPVACVRESVAWHLENPPVVQR